VPLLDSAGSIYAVCGISADITEQKRAEHLLLNYAEDVAGTAPLAVVGVDALGRIHRVNRFALGLTGYTEEEVKGKGWFGLLAVPGDEERLLLLIAEAFQGSMQQGMQVDIRAKDGRRIAMPAPAFAAPWTPPKPRERAAVNTFCWRGA